MDKKKNEIIKKNNRKKTKFVVLLTIMIIAITIFALKKTFLNKKEENKIVQANIIEEPKKEDLDEIIKGWNVTREGSKYAIDRNDVEDMVSNKYSKDNDKIVFLTFDDGPNIETTENILNILKDKEVKATFFVLGNNIEKSDKVKELLKRELKEGHAIGNHSYSHDYKKLYPKGIVDVDAFMNEIKKTNDLIRQAVGENFDTKVVRMPAGHMSRNKDSNIKNLDNILKQDGYASIDWNCLNGDGENKKYSNIEMVNYIKNTSKNKNKVVILMHDAPGKLKTGEILPEVIDYFKQQGYQFKTIM